MNIVALHITNVSMEIILLFSRGFLRIFKLTLFVLFSMIPLLFAQQQAYAASKAADSAQQAMDDYEASQEARLTAAEDAVKIWLERVKTEQSAVQQAVNDLTAAQKEMDGGALSKLRAGGLPKQMALVGLLLFSVRSIVDTVAALTDPSLMMGALVQAGIALACAAYLFLL